MEKITVTSEEVIAEFDEWVEKCKETSQGEWSQEVELILKQALCKFLGNAKTEHCEKVFIKEMINIFFKCVDNGLIDSVLEKLEMEDEK